MRRLCVGIDFGAKRLMLTPVIVNFVGLEIRLLENPIENFLIKSI